MGSGVLRFGAVSLCLFSLAFEHVQAACSGDTTISTAAALESHLSNGCETWHGNITFEWKDMSGGLSAYIQTLAHTHIDGSLIFTDSRTTTAGERLSINAGQLQTISGQLLFSNIGGLTMPTFSRLDSVDSVVFSNVTFADDQVSFGSLSFPALRQTRMITFSKTTVSDIGITWPASLDLTNDTASAGVATLDIHDNSQLGSIQILGYGGRHMDIDIAGNLESLYVDLPNITDCNINLEGVAAFTAETLGRIGPAGGKSSAKHSRRQQATDGQNTMTGNTFTSLDLGALSTIDGPLQISNNEELTSVSFGQLSSVTGDLDISGDAITSITLGPLSNSGLQGQLTVAASNFECSSLSVNGDSVACNDASQPSATGIATSDGHNDNNGGSGSGSDNSNNPAAPNPTPTPGSSNNGLTAGAKAGIGVGVALAVLLLALLAFILYRRRSRHSPSSRSPDPYGRKDLPSTSEATTTTSPLSPQRYSKVPSEMRTEELAPQQRPVSGVSFDDNNERNGGGFGGGGISDRAPRISDDRGDGSGRTHNRRGLSNERAVELEEQQGERFEMEEQQGMRHEMDARSLPDIDLDDDDVERRSLEDIERARNSGPTAGGGLGHGPVSPVG